MLQRMAIFKALAMTTKDGPSVLQQMSSGSTMKLL